jgi:hypothetical protein
MAASYAIEMFRNRKNLQGFKPLGFMAFGL